MASSGAWGPPPPGVDLSENQDVQIIAAVSVVMIFGLGAVALRMFARLTRAGPGLGIDDYAILAASVGIL